MRLRLGPVVGRPDLGLAAAGRGRPRAAGCATGGWCWCRATPERVLDEADAGARRAARLARRLHGAPFARAAVAGHPRGRRRVDVPTSRRRCGRWPPGAPTVVTGPVEESADEPVAEAVDAERRPTTPARRRWTHPGPAIAHGIGVVAARLRSRPDVEAPGAERRRRAAEPVVASATPSPLRHLVPGRRTEVSRDVRPTGWPAPTR